MAYCTEANVQAEFKAISFGASTAVTSSQVAEFIAEVDAYIDGRIGLIYETPITGTASLLIMRMISRRLVANRIKGILAVKTGNSSTDQDAKQDTSEEVSELLEMIVNGEYRLSDATLRDSSNGVKSPNVSLVSAHTFQAGVKQW